MNMPAKNIKIKYLKSLIISNITHEKINTKINLYLSSNVCSKSKGPIVYFIDGRSPSRHKWRFWI